MARRTRSRTEGFRFTGGVAGATLGAVQGDDSHVPTFSDHHGTATPRISLRPMGGSRGGAAVSGGRHWGSRLQQEREKGPANRLIDFKAAFVGGTQWPGLIPGGAGA